MKKFIVGLTVWWTILGFTQWTLFLHKWHWSARLAFAIIMLLIISKDDDAPPAPGEELKIENKISY